MQNQFSRLQIHGDMVAFEKANHKKARKSDDIWNMDVCTLSDLTVADLFRIDAHVTESSRHRNVL
jgi:hypothetical protein